MVKDRCNSLGLPYIHGNIEHHTTQVMVPVNLCPSSTARIVADGNCFFRSLSFVLTGSQEFHQEVCLLVTTYMIDNTGNPQLSSLIKDGERMENYIEQILKHARCAIAFEHVLLLMHYLCKIGVVFCIQTSRAWFWEQVPFL